MFFIQISFTFSFVSAKATHVGDEHAQHMKLLHTGSCSLPNKRLETSKSMTLILDENIAEVRDKGPVMND